MLITSHALTNVILKPEISKDNNNSLSIKAKKIKNGARKIVLDKAEEARAAAFSAFKSLGYSIPQFSRPLILNGSPGGQEAANDNLVVLEDVNLDTILQSNIVLENPTAVTGDTGNAAVEQCRSTKMATVGEYPYHGMQDRLNEDLCVGTADGACGKGPLNAVNTPGGFDSFLELWETAVQFYFDIHFNRRSETNYVAPFEIHGIAICWENSSVYYINFPKDLLWLYNRKNNFLSTSASSDKRNNLPPEHLLEMAKLRWKENCVDSLADEETSSSPNLDKEVKKRLPNEAAAAANQSGRWKNQMRRAAHNGCCRRVAQTRALCSALWKLLVSEKLIEVFTYIETPLVNSAIHFSIFERHIRSRFGVNSLVVGNSLRRNHG
ncbi:hypothetical protein F3Y22_tig00110321pilonHSYRG00229 [Hibiscus syriacus]|uniref:Uncharacterized protein n=1 Tax=Hibiscus syriacus TaxID=106335 RepID=A0A6A3B3M7_HIBSY|nr:hypothetical protein F3Y22_tig00110321pilonHSYRG00229 [Hibiscus syriacus]